MECQCEHKGWHLAAYVLLLVGALNWLLVGVFGWDVGELFGGQGAVVSRIIYILVGLAAIYKIATWGGKGKESKPETTMPQV